MSYKLTYFSLTALGEPIRFLLSYTGIKFEDIRVNFEDWPKHKANTPMGQLPVLEIDGKKYNQSKAIARFIAKRNNLYGSNDFEALEIDAAVDAMDDLRLAVSTWYWEKDETHKAKLKDILFTKLPFFLGKFEEQVKRNGGHFVAGKMSWADVHYAAYCEFMSNILGYDVNKDHPELKKLVGKVLANGNIKAYIAKRPKTQF